MREFQVGDVVRVNNTAPLQSRGHQGRLQRAYGPWAGSLDGIVFEASELDLVSPAETQQTQLPPVSVASLALPLDEPVNVPADPNVEPQPYDMPSPEADALDRIADLWGGPSPDTLALRAIAVILRETGRLASVFDLESS